MKRETAFDVLLGTVLFLIFAILVAAAVGGLGLALYAIDVAVKHFTPGMPRRWDALFYVYLGLWALIRAIGHLRRHRWLGAFLSFAVLPMMASVFLAGPQTQLRDNAFFMWPWIVVVFVASNDALLTRFEFALTGFVVSATVAVNTGLLGAGTLSRVAANSVFVAVIALIGIYFVRVRRKWNGSTTTPLTTT